MKSTYKRRFQLTDRRASITEHLTKGNLQLVQECKKVAPSKKDVWSEEGKIYARVKGKKKSLIKNTEDMERKFSSPPADRSVASKSTLSHNTKTTSSIKGNPNISPHATYPNNVPLGKRRTNSGTKAHEPLLTPITTVTGSIFGLVPSSNASKGISESPNTGTAPMAETTDPLSTASSQSPKDSTVIGRDNKLNPSHINFASVENNILDDSTNKWNMGSPSLPPAFSDPDKPGCSYSNDQSSTIDKHFLGVH